ncbi:hypothetical protein [Bacillus taeanensis]|uniref:MerR family transcriptional regulator n=1 Tax=Bacillus taeanensis TaxID=273032 RepID=A0A366XP56_9BACI|nr:hypothetical protein [Bacillus taeanensis]RBW67892.1 hypothetical protein DS031_19610 [Bacillus taeanensis]
MAQFWKSSDFAKLIGKHPNTVANWFKQLEARGLHYIGRTQNNEKVYDELDLEIARHINEKRGEKWALNAIFENVKEHFELRSPGEYVQNTNTPQTQNMETIKNEIMTAAQEIANTQVQEVKEHYEKLLRSLPQPKTAEQEREERIAEMVRIRKIETELVEEAQRIWALEPEIERMKKGSFFGKEEDQIKRDQFVRDYVNRHFEDRIRKKFFHEVR